MAFLTTNSFFKWVLKIPTNMTFVQYDICESIVFKAESKPKHKEEETCWGVFLQKPRTLFLRGPK